MKEEYLHRMAQETNKKKIESSQEAKKGNGKQEFKEPQKIFSYPFLKYSCIKIACYFAGL
jgi:hypothetical protein